MSLSSFLKPANEEVVLILDIGSGSVGAALAMISKTANPKILFTVRFAFSVTGKPQGDKLFASTLDALEKAIASVLRDGLTHLNFLKLSHKKIKEVLCVFSSPWQISQTRVLKVEKTIPFLVSKKFLDDLVRNATANQNSASTGKDVPTEITLEQKIIQTRLNGYETSVPYDKKAKTVEVSTFMGTLPGSVFSGVERVISKLLGHKKISFHTLPLVSCNILADIFSKDTNYCVLDINGEITDVSFVKRGVIVETVSLPLGRNSLARMVAQELNVNSEIAFSYLKLFSENAAELSLESKMKNLIENFGKEWKAYLGEAIVNFSKTDTIPGKVYITSVSDVAPIFQGYMNSYSSVLGTNFSLVNVDQELLDHFSSYASKVRADTFLAIESMFASKTFGFH